MTIEELEIIVSVKIAEAIKEFKKIIPVIKQTVQKAQESFEKMDTTKMKKNINQAVQQIKKKMQDLRKSNENNQIKLNINNKDAQKQISQIQKQIDSLNEKINSRQMKLNTITPRLDEITAQTTKAVTPQGVSPDNPAIQKTVNNSLSSNKEYTSLLAQESKMTQEIAMYNKQLTIAKNKMAQLKSETNNTATSQNKLTSFFKGFGSKVKQAVSNSKGISNNLKDLPKITNKINFNGLNKGIKRGIGHVFRYSGALLSLKSIYGLLSSSANAWLNSQNAGAQQLNANIEYMKYAMGSVLAPVIQFVTNLVYQLMKAVQSVVYALTGVNIFANAGAKAYSNMANSAKKASKESKQLAGVHDEINNIQETNPDGGNGGSGSIAPNFDLSQIDSQMSAFAQKLYEFFKPLKDSWNIYGPQLVEQIKTTASQVGYLISSVWGSFENIITNGTVYSILENILAIIGNIAQAWANAWNYNNNGDVIIQNLANAFNNLLVAINNVVSSPEFQAWLNNCSDKFREISEKIASIDWQPLVNALFEIGSTIGMIALNILSGLVDIFKWFVENPTIAEVILGIAIAISTISSAISTLGPIISTIKAVISGLSSAFGALSSAFSISTGSIGLIILAITALITALIYLYQNFETVRDIVNGAIESIRETFVNLYNEHLKPLIDNIVSLLQMLWNDVLKPLIDWFIANVLPVLVPIFESLWNTICSVVGAIIDVISGVITTLKGIIEFIVGVFTGDWEKAWQGIKDFFSGIWDTIKGIVTAVWNAISGIITTAVNAIKGTITTVFNAVATIVSNIWNGIWGAIRGVINSILGGIEGMANGVVNGINKVIDVLNNLQVHIPDWIPLFGGKDIGFHINHMGTVSLPRLAKGGVLYEERAFVGGEYSGARTNPEIVTPQNIMEETFDRVLSRYQGNSSEQPIRVQVYFGAKNVIDEVIDGINEKARRTGRAQIKVEYA